MCVFLRLGYVVPSLIDNAKVLYAVFGLYAASPSSQLRSLCCIRHHKFKLAHHHDPYCCSGSCMVPPRPVTILPDFAGGGGGGDAQLVCSPKYISSSRLESRTLTVDNALLRLATTANPAVDALSAHHVSIP